MCYTYFRIKDMTVLFARRCFIFSTMIFTVDCSYQVTVAFFFFHSMIRLVSAEGKTAGLSLIEAFIVFVDLLQYRHYRGNGDGDTTEDATPRW
uniref:Uncharacterized protein n=1 Tax=Rhipicephalus zambeziensis TaxID=60191 RepID=A0A224YG90_9ACAR